MALKSVTGLTTPCVLVLDCGFQAGRHVRIQGSVPCGSQWFSVNFCCSDGPSCDIAFHFNPRLDQNCVVFNTFQNRSWQCNQTKEENPFKHGASFQLDIHITEEHFEVLVNNNVFDRYSHRIPLCQVKSLEVQPKVDIHKIEFF
ncbi:galectin-7 [Alligator mississippiensis]|uniref:Galectin n=1 Tax=Alligator mississippiensis TaxID=8496 RepID=A0A151PGM4_ALLMI|nr:galectin-7 [Alligator mississippiensis]KYO47935.1 galectin-7 [Alligator mississippiensis]